MAAIVGSIVLHYVSYRYNIKSRDRGCIRIDCLLQMEIEVMGPSYARTIRWNHGANSSSTQEFSDRAPSGVPITFTKSNILQTKK